MFTIRWLSSAPIFAILFAVAVTIAPAPSAEIYRMTSGSYRWCCTIWGGGFSVLPTPEQMFVELTRDAEANTAQMRILDVLLMEEYQIWSHADLPYESPFSHGTTNGNTIRFYNDHIEPAPPWDDPSDEFYGWIDYTILLEEGQMQMTGMFRTIPSCTDCFENFSHMFVQADVVEHPVPGDLNEDGQLDIRDLEELAVYRSYPEYLIRWVKDVRRTWLGDANLDGEFNRGDLVQVLSAGKYETEQHAGWADGDWDGDGVFDNSDLVKALEDGGYEHDIWLLGDFNRNGVIDVDDINILTEVSASGTGLPPHDLNFDGLINVDDIKFWVESKDIGNTWIGDANFDAVFNMDDLAQVLEAGKYEQRVSAAWSEGDWNGDGMFGTGDLVLALEGGGYELGPRPNSAAVPEPGAWMLCLAAMTLPWLTRR